MMRTKEFILFAFFTATAALAQSFIVANGKPNGEIVIAVDAPPMVELAANDLQTYVRKMSGATLPLVREPGTAAIKIYVGESEFTDVKGGDLKYGAYRMESGPNWLALVGNDEPYVPKSLEAMTFLNRGDPEKETLYQEWDKRTGGLWGLPFGQVYKQIDRGRGFSEFDERGSFNAVCAFLRMQGVRWYERGELGEVVPEKRSIALPDVDRTVRPDFDLRHPYCMGGRFGQAPMDYVLYQVRLGVHRAPDLVGIGHIGHGIADVHKREEMKQTHPEYYAWINGERDMERYGKPCLSAEGLLRQNVAYARAIYAHFDQPMVSVMPGDGFGSICRCPLCVGGADPDRGWYGQFSEYVWTYVNDVGRALYQTHPDRIILCNAYTTYREPPSNIDKLSPNVAVGICQLRRRLTDPAKRQGMEALRRAWLAKQPAGSKLFIYDYLLEAWRKQYKGLPAFYPHAIAQDLRSLKGLCRGEFTEVLPRGPMWLNLYVLGRMWWDADLDVDALLEEYYTLYYGPARDEMKAFIEYSEANWENMPQDRRRIDIALDWLAKASAKAPAGSVYARRIAKLTEYCQPLTDLKVQLAKEREDVPLLRYCSVDPELVTIDGKLDDTIWSGHLAAGDVRLPYQSRGSLKDLQTGKEPEHKGRFVVAYADGHLFFGIKCMDDPATINSGATRDDDINIWSGDCIELLIETQNHSYYQIVVAPSGALVDLDRQDRLNLRWSSNAQVATHIGTNYWSAEIRLPMPRGDMQTIVDPLHGIEGRPPTKTFPWYINLCRARVRPTGTELTAYSPTGTDSFHVLEKFARFHAK